MKSIHIIYASISGHTEYVVDVLSAFLRGKADGISLRKTRAEVATPEDLLSADCTILACGTWNTTGQEGSLSPHMFEFLTKRAAETDLTGRKIAFISLGDERYFYTCRCTEHLMHFQREHHAEQLLTPLVIVNEPYGQDEKICEWGVKLLNALEKQAVEAT